MRNYNKTKIYMIKSENHPEKGIFSKG